MKKTFIMSNTMIRSNLKITFCYILKFIIHVDINLCEIVSVLSMRALIAMSNMLNIANARKVV